MEIHKLLAEKLGLESEKVKSVIRESKLTVLTETGKETLLKNNGSESFNKGKNAGVNMQFSTLKKSYAEGDNLAAKAFENATGIEDVLVNINKAHETTLEAKLAEQKANYEGNVDERVGALQEKYTSLEQTYQNEKKALQEQFNLEKQSKEQIVQEYDQKFTNMKTDYLLQDQFSALNFTVPKDVEAKGNDAIAEYNKIKRRNSMVLFKQNYNVEFENNEPYFVDSATGSKIVNDLQNPLPLPELMKIFIETNYLNVVSNREGGRGGDDNYKNNGLSGVNTMDKFAQYAESKGLKKGSRAYADLFREVTTANPNGNF